jgi:hypothetical protein
MSTADRARILEELDRERRLLLKADADIVQGEIRVCNQQKLVARLGGVDDDVDDAEVVEARRLLQILDDTLLEWEHHRILIRERIAHLEKQAAAS